MATLFFFLIEAFLLAFLNSIKSILEIKFVNSDSPFQKNLTIRRH